MKIVLTPERVSGTILEELLSIEMNNKMLRYRFYLPRTGSLLSLKTAEDSHGGAARGQKA